MLRCSDVTVRFGSRTALEGASLAVEAGQWWMLAGPNGAGKTTLIRAISQAVPYTGSITLEDRPLERMRPAERARIVGVLAQHNGARFAYTVEEIVRLGRFAHRRSFLDGGDPGEREAVEEALRLTGMEDFRHASVLTLSGGERQRAFLAQVLAQRPRLMILDEPVNHLDPPYQQAVFDLIADWLRTPGRAVLSVVHDLTLAKRCATHALVLREGRTLACGEAKNALADDVLREAYGMDVAAWMRGLTEVWRERD